MLIRPREEDAQIERAISFLVEKIQEFNTNPKPLILHSLRVGLRLYQKGERTDIVIAGLLHDLLEDTNCTKEDLTGQVREKLADFISVFDYDDPTKHYKDRWTKAITQMRELGRDAAIIKTVDIRDNLQYLTLAKNDIEAVEGIIWRHNLVRDSFKELLAGDEDYQGYCKELEEKKKLLDVALG